MIYSGCAMAKYGLLSLIILVNLAFSQGGKSIHQIEWEYYKTHFKEPAYKPFTGPAIDKQPRTTGPTRTIFGYHPYWQGTLWKNYNYELLTTIAYFSAEADGSGNLINLHGWPVTDLINMAHTNGVNVVLTVTLFSSSQLETLLSSSQNRQRLITNLLSEVKRANADGVNVDFEAFPASQKTNLVTFIQDLATTFHDSIPNSTVTLATPAVDWNSAWDYKGLAQASDGLFIMGYDFQWSGSSFTGAVAPLTGGTYNVTNSVTDYLTKTGGMADKIILGCPYYGYEWPANSGDPGAAVSATGKAVIFSTAEAKALSYGKLWDTTTNTPWYRFQSGGWNQGWYDDSLSLCKKYDLALSKNLQGVGMWALGYDQSYTVLWDALAAKFGTPTAPSTPQQLTIRNLGQGVISLDFTGAESATAFSITRVFLSSTDTVDLGTFTNRPILLQGLTENEPYYLKIKARNSLGESHYTEVLGTVPGVESRVLVVNGFDRISGTRNTFDFIRQHGSAIHSAGYGFDAASNEAVIAGRVRLTEYDFVDWILGEEGTATSTFTTTEQQLVQEYLERGGNLLVSGSEIGYDLSDKGDLNDQLFYQNYLKATYLTDAAAGKQGTYGAQGVVNTLLADIHLNFDNGQHGTYDVDWPDGIKPTGGAETILKYDGVNYTSSGGAGIAYRGVFGSSFLTGSLVYLAIGFEAIYPESTRNEIMARILEYLKGPETAVTDEDDLTPNRLEITAVYPNPSNGAVTIEFNVSLQERAATLIITDILGREIQKIQVFALKTRLQKYRWNGLLRDGSEAGSGIYVATLKQGSVIKTRKFTLLK